jgi:1,4-dihydroxy-2-naphthoate octaprenyltransferase
MSRGASWALGAVILGEAAHLALVLGVIGVAALRGGGNPVGHLPMGMGELIAHFVTGSLLVSIALFVLVRHAQENQRLDPAGRRRWLVLLALWGPVTMPVYWWRFVRTLP